MGGLDNRPELAGAGKILFGIVMLNPVVSPSIADECKRYDFKPPTGAVANVPLAVELVTWAGGTQVECEKLRSKVSEYLEKRYRDADAEQSAARKRWIDSTYTSDLPIDQSRERTRRAKDESDKAEARLRQARDDRYGVGPCECVERGESDSEKKLRREREERKERDAQAEAEASDRKAKREAEEAARRAAREAEQKNREAARKLDEQKKQLQEQAARATQAEDKRRLEKAAAVADQEARAADRAADRARAVAQASNPTSAPTVPGDPGRQGQLLGGHDALSQVVDPYAEHPQVASGSVAALVDPYSEGPKLVDPFANPSKEAGEQALTFVEKGIESSEHSLEKAITAAPQQLKGRQLTRYLEEAQDTQSCLRGLRRFFKGLEIAGGIKEAMQAETSQKRNEAVGALGGTVLKDLTQDIAKEGLVKVTGRLFGESAAVVLSGPVAWVAAVGLDVVTPTETSRDPLEVIEDKSGHTSLSEKQEALAVFWKQYDHHGAAWQPAQVRQLLDATQTVYRESSKRK